MTTKYKWKQRRNQPTEIVCYWLKNEVTARYWRGVAYDLKMAALAREEDDQELEFPFPNPFYDFVVRLKAEVAGHLPGRGVSLYWDLLQTALSDVDWYDVAEIFYGPR